MPEQILKAIKVVNLTLAPDILLSLDQNPQRFTDLKHGISVDRSQEVHSSTFTRALRRLKRHQLVTLDDGEYHLTEAGLGFIPFLMNVRLWAARFPDSLDPKPSQPA